MPPYVCGLTLAYWQVHSAPGQACRLVVRSTLWGAFVEDIRAAGFDVLFAPTPHNPFHVHIVAKTHTFDAAGREALALAFDRIVRQR